MVRNVALRLAILGWMAGNHLAQAAPFTQMLSGLFGTEGPQAALAPLAPPMVAQMLTPALAQAAAPMALGQPPGSFPSGPVEAASDNPFSREAPRFNPNGVERFNDDDYDRDDDSDFERDFRGGGRRDSDGYRKPHHSNDEHPYPYETDSYKPSKSYGEKNQYPSEYGKPTYGSPDQQYGNSNPQYGQQPFYGNSIPQPAYGNNQQYNQPSAYGNSIPQYGQQPSYGNVSPQYGQQPSYGNKNRQPTYGSNIPQYGQQPIYGNNQQYAQQPIYGNTPPPYVM